MWLITHSRADKADIAFTKETLLDHWKERLGAWGLKYAVVAREDHE